MGKCPICGKQNPDDSKFCNDCGHSFRDSNQTGQLNADTILEGRYIIVKTLGRGGMGAVYMALDSRLNNMPIAIKEMSTNAVGAGNLQAAIGAFKKEASMLTALKHPALPIIRDFFAKGEDRWFLVMDFIEGQTLKLEILKRGVIPEAEVTDWAFQLCDILNFLHKRNPPIIFRDLKPDNIMLTPEGQIKLIDFGIARHFQQGNISDTIAYGSSGFAPPEQYGKNQTDIRSDIYALGATIHYLLTGKDPAKNPFMFEPPSKHATVSTRMEKAILKALEMTPDNRPQNIDEFIMLLPQRVAKNLPRQKSLPEKTKPSGKETGVSKLNQAVTTPLTGDNISPQTNEMKKFNKTSALMPGGNTTVPMEPIDSNKEMMGRLTQPLNHNPVKAAGPPDINKRSNSKRIVVAACLVLCLSAGIYFFNHNHLQVFETNQPQGKQVTSNSSAVPTTDNNYLLSPNTPTNVTVSKDSTVSAAKDTKSSSASGEPTSSAADESISSASVETASSILDTSSAAHTETSSDTNRQTAKTPSVFDYIENTPEFPGLYNARSGDKWGIADRDGNTLIAPTYDYAFRRDSPHASEGFYCIRVGSKYGFLSQDGSSVIKPKYDWVGAFDGGYAAVQIGNEYGFIDRSGTVVKWGVTDLTQRP